MARSVELEKAQAEIRLLKGELARLHKEGRSLRLQLEEAKATTANEVSEYQSSEEIPTLNQTLHDEGYAEAAEAFAYTVATTRWDWDLAFLGEHLTDLIAAWHAEHRAAHPLVDERPASPAVARPPSPTVEPLVILLLLLRFIPSRSLRTTRSQ